MKKPQNGAVGIYSAAEWRWQALRISGALTQQFRDEYQPGTVMISPQAVIDILTAAKVRFVLMGTYGVQSYRRQPRATQDVDVLVRKGDHAKAVRAIRKAYPTLRVKDYPVVTRFIDPAIDDGVIDLLKPAQDIFQMAFKEVVLVKNKYFIPNLEMALVSKFAAMTSPRRDYAKKLIDGGDFVDMVKNNLKAMDRPKLHRLAEKLYPGAGKEIMENVANIAAGRPIQF